MSGGENIYPAEVENALFGHPAVADVAVIGVPDERWGEAVKAVVVVQAGRRGRRAEELIDYCRERASPATSCRDIGRLHRSAAAQPDGQDRSCAARAVLGGEAGGSTETCFGSFTWISRC